jgi:hypothetical protein
VQQGGDNHDMEDGSMDAGMGALDAIIALM